MHRKSKLRARTSRTALITAVLALTACADTQSTQPANPDLIDVSALGRLMQSRLSMTVGDTQTVTSRVVKWATKENKIVSWQTTSTRVVSVNSKGFIAALDSGAAYVLVSAGPHVDSIPVTVSSSVPSSPGAPTVGSVSVVASTTNLVIGQSVLLTAQVQDVNGNPMSGVPITWASSKPAVLDVSSGGVALALTAGTAAASATAAGVSGSLTFKTVAPPPPPSGGSVAVPVMPQLLNIAYPAVTGNQILVKAGDNLQAALNSAKRGDEIVLQAGATFSGHFVLPAKSGQSSNGWIVIRSDRQSQLPPSGSRVRPTDVGKMATIQTPDQAPAIATAPGASGWWISGVEITVNPSWNKQIYTIVALGDGGSKQSQLSQVPSDLVLDRVYVHGTATSQISRCIGLNSASTSIVDSYIFDCHGKGFDSQAIQGSNGPGPFKIVNNTLAGAGENVMFGGSDPNIPNLIPSDIELRRNYIYTPPSWNKIWTKKNLIETKNVRRMLIEGNVLEGSWRDGQQGVGIAFKSANQSGRCLWCQSGDITFRYNILRKVAQAVALTGYEGSSPYKVGARLYRVSIENNIIDSLNFGIYQGDPRIILVINTPTDVSIRRNTMSSVGPFSTFLTLSTPPAINNMEFVGNIAMTGNYGFMGEGGAGMGTAALKNVTGTAMFTSNVLVGGNRGVPYPSSTTFVTSMSAALGMANVGANSALVLQMTSGVIIP